MEIFNDSGEIALKTKEMEKPESKAVRKTKKKQWSLKKLLNNESSLQQPHLYLSVMPSLKMMSLEGSSFCVYALGL